MLQKIAYGILNWRSYNKKTSVSDVTKKRHQFLLQTFQFKKSANLEAIFENQTVHFSDDS